MKIEICIDAAERMAAASQGGADRVELCADLPAGGRPIVKQIGIGGTAIESCTFSRLRTKRADFHEVLRGPEVRVRYPFLAAGVIGADTR